MSWLSRSVCQLRPSCHTSKKKCRRYSRLRPPCSSYTPRGILMTLKRRRGNPPTSTSIRALWFRSQSGQPPGGDQVEWSITFSIPSARSTHSLRRYHVTVQPPLCVHPVQDLGRAPAGQRLDHLVGPDARGPHEQVRGRPVERPGVVELQVPLHVLATPPAGDAEDLVAALQHLHEGDPPGPADGLGLRLEHPGDLVHLARTGTTLEYPADAQAPPPRR